MRESHLYGSVRGVLGNWHSYRDSLKPGEALHLMGCASKKSQMTVLASRLREVFPVIMAGR